MSERSNKRALVWDEMKSLEDAGLGERQVVSEDRDRFMLDAGHAAAYRLSENPGARGFIRADSRTLLFRNASDQLRQLLTSPHDMSCASEKGVEFRWSEVDEQAIRRFFEHVSQLARS